MAKSVNVMDYIPPALWSDIETYAYSTDLSVYLQAAHDDAGSGIGVGGEVTYPAGGFLAAEISTYRQQYVHGAWQSTIFKQIDDKSVFVTSEWKADDQHYRLGRYWENLNFITDDPLAGGYAIIDFGYRDQMRSINSTGLPVLLTGATKNLPARDGTGGHAIDNLYVNFSPRGGLVSQQVTDVQLTRSTFNACGALGGSAAIEASAIAGWQMETLKIFSCPGKIFHVPHSIWNATLLGSMIDWEGGDGVGLDFTNALAGEQGIRMIGNDFRIKATAPGDYTMISIGGSVPARCVHVGNKYWIDPVVAAASTINAIRLSGSIYSGASGHNDYVNFRPDQRGNIDALLGLQPLDFLGRL